MPPKGYKSSPEQLEKRRIANAKHREEVPKTTCRKRLHPWVPENIRTSKNGVNYCIACEKAGKERYIERVGGENAYKKLKNVEYAKGADKQKNKNLLANFGISLEEYKKIFDAQDGCCDICGKHQVELTRTLTVDHCHVTGQIRGLICHKCNSGIGMLGDTLESVQKAVNYLQKAQNKNNVI